MSATNNNNTQYDDRRGREYGEHRYSSRDPKDQVRYGGSQHRPSSTRERSRSPDAERGQDYFSSKQKEQSKSSPGEEKERLERERRARMARLRAENDDEEQQLTALDQQTSEDKHTRKPREDIVRLDENELEGMDEEEQMRRLLGFSGGFATTKGREVEDNQKSAARGAAAKNKARKYRQYMNRKGGFNKPLEKMD